MSNSKAYTQTADLILAALDEGVAPWQKPWSNGAANMGATGHTYRGWNAFWTAFVAMQEGYSSPVWATFNQIKKQGCALKNAKGKGVKVIAWMVVTKDKDGKALPKEKRFAAPRAYTVFNLDLVEGDFKIPKKASEATATENEHTVIASCEDVVSAYQGAPTVTHGGDAAAYSPDSDRIRMPAPERFTSSEEYYCALFHEMAHSTGHSSRLGRKGVTDKNSFASHAYGQEELVAEFTASFLCGVAGIADRTLDNSAAYIAGWKNAIKADRTIVLKAIGQAQKAADRILGLEAPAYVEEDEKATA